MRLNNGRWAYVLLPILVIIIFVLLLQNTYLKGIADQQSQQVEELQQTLDSTKKQLNEIQRTQNDTTKKLNTIDDNTDEPAPIPATPQSYTAPATNNTTKQSTKTNNGKATK